MSKANLERLPRAKRVIHGQEVWVTLCPPMHAEWPSTTSRYRKRDL